MSENTRNWCQQMAIQHISFWRENKAKGLPRTAAWARGEALWWLAQSKRGK